MRPAPPPDMPQVAVGDRVVVGNVREGEPRELRGVVTHVHPDGACVSLDPFNRIEGAALRRVVADQFVPYHQIQKPAGRR